MDVLDLFPCMPVAFNHDGPMKNPIQCAQINSCVAEQGTYIRARTPLSHWGPLARVDVYESRPKEFACEIDCE
jgi:hypothetical protein